MEQPIHTEEYKDYKIKIFHDTSEDNPDDWGNDDVFLVFDHRQFHVERKGFKPQDIYDYLALKDEISKLERLKSLKDLDFNENDLEDLQDELAGYFDYDSEYHIFSLFAYIHSGISLSLGNTSYPFNCRWDTSNTGFVLVKKELTVYDEKTQVKDIVIDELKVEENAQGLVDTWNDYLSGNVYGYVITKPIEHYKISKTNLNKSISTAYQYINLASFLEKAEVITEYEEENGCWGYYGNYEKGALKEAKEYIDCVTNKLN